MRYILSLALSMLLSGVLCADEFLDRVAAVERLSQKPAKPAAKDCGCSLGEPCTCVGECLCGGNADRPWHKCGDGLFRGRSAGVSYLYNPETGTYHGGVWGTMPTKQLKAFTICGPGGCKTVWR